MFWRPLCQLRSKDYLISDSFKTRDTGNAEKPTDFEIVLVRQRVLDSLDQLLARQDLLCHLVHSGLHAGTVIFSKSLQSDLASSGPGSIELRHVRADLLESTEILPLPSGIDVGAQDTVPGLLKCGVLVTQEAPELRVGALQHGQAGQRRLDIDALALDHVHLHIPLLLAVADEGVRVWLAVNVHPGPAVADNVDVSGMDVVVLLNEVCAQDGAEQLGRSNGVLLGGDVNGVLNGVGCDNDAVVGLGVTAVLGY